MKFANSIEDRIYRYNEGLKPLKDIRGIESDIVMFGGFDERNTDSLRREYLKTFNKIYYTKLDSTVQKSDFIVSRTKSGNLGFETNISIKSLSEGKHILEFKRKAISKDKDTLYYSIAKIPFWYYPD